MAKLTLFEVLDKTNIFSFNDILLIHLFLDTLLYTKVSILSFSPFKNLHNFFKFICGWSIVIITKMRDLIGIVKDKVSLSKLALISKPNTLSLHIAVLRTTSHTPSTPPNDHHITTLLSLGDSSRATASVLIHSLMNRLHRTNDSYVALKCLFTIHHIIKRGPFILKDQLSVFHYTGGHDHGRIYM